MSGTSKRAVALGFVAGVVVGVIGTFFIIHHGPASVRQESQAVRDTRVLTMTPKQFVARCGNLVRDKVKSGLLGGAFGALYGRIVTVRMALPTGQKKDITAAFQNIGKNTKEPDWRLVAVGQYRARPSPLGELKTIEELYPCTTKP